MLSHETRKIARNDNRMYGRSWLLFMMISSPECRSLEADSCVTDEGVEGPRSIMIVVVTACRLMNWMLPVLMETWTCKRYLHF